MASRVLRPLAAVLVGPPEHRNGLDTAEAGLFLDTGDRRYKLQRFGLLLVIAAIIAAGGLVMDSTVVLIGAMLIAPLAIPIMGVALAVATGMGARLRTAVLGVAVGAVVCIVIGGIMSVLIPPAENPLLNPQIASRISPGLVDLIVALATGVIGAVGVARKDISDVLPGFAIAISLVPPMCVTGICLVRGLYGAALGSTILFATNVLAMILAGVLIFGLVGYTRMAAERESVHVDRRSAGVVIVAALVAVLIPLALQTWDSLREATTRFGAEQAAVTWIDGMNTSGGSWVLTNVEFLGDKIIVKILGAGAEPDTDELLRLLNAQVAREVPVQVDVYDGRTIQAGTTSPGVSTG